MIPQYYNPDGILYKDLLNKDKFLYQKFYRRMKKWGLSPEQAYQTLDMDKKEIFEKMNLRRKIQENCKFINADGIPYYELISDDRKLDKFYRRMKKWGLTPEQAYQTLELNKREVMKKYNKAFVLHRKYAYYNSDGISYKKIINDEKLYHRFKHRIKNWGITPEKSFEILHLVGDDALKAIGAKMPSIYPEKTPNGLAICTIKRRRRLYQMTLKEALETPRKTAGRYFIDDKPVHKCLNRIEYNRFLNWLRKGYSIKGAFEMAKTLQKNKVPNEIDRLEGNDRIRAYRRWKYLGWSVEDAVNQPIVSCQESGRRSYQKYLLNVKRKRGNNEL